MHSDFNIFRGIKGFRSWHFLSKCQITSTGKYSEAKKWFTHIKLPWNVIILIYMLFRSNDFRLNTKMHILFFKHGWDQPHTVANWQRLKWGDWCYSHVRMVNTRYSLQYLPKTMKYKNSQTLFMLNYMSSCL